MGARKGHAQAGAAHTARAGAQWQTCREGGSGQLSAWAALGRCQAACQQLMGTGAALLGSPSTTSLQRRCITSKTWWRLPPLPPSQGPQPNPA